MSIVIITKTKMVEIVIAIAPQKFRVNCHNITKVGFDLLILIWHAVSLDVVQFSGSAFY